MWDVAVALGVMAGVDPTDPTTTASHHRQTDYTRHLDPEALTGARIGVARDFMGSDPDVDWVVEAALDTMRRSGATVVDVRYPSWLLDVKTAWYRTICFREFKAQVEQYLATLAPGYPRTLAEMIDRTQQHPSGTPGGGRPNPRRWGLFREEEESGGLDDYEYLAMRYHGLAHVRAIIEGILATNGIDAIVYPTSPNRPVPAGAEEEGVSATNLANLTGFPDLTVPAGFTGDLLPVGLSFHGRAFSEPRLLALGHAFEHATRARRDPVHTPALDGEHLGAQDRQPTRGPHPTNP